MPEVLVVSDSHLHNDILENIFKAHPTIDTCFHCGDIQDDPKHLSIAHLYIVQGNTDVAGMPQELEMDEAGFHLLIVHGHRQCVEDGLDQLIAYGHEKKADLLLFGHTHHPLVLKDGKMTILNPGSVAFPRGGKIFIPTYAILTLDSSITVHFYHAKTHACVDDIVLGTAQKKKKKSLFSFFKR